MVKTTKMPMAAEIARAARAAGIVEAARMMTAWTVKVRTGIPAMTVTLRTTTTTKHLR